MITGKIPLKDAAAIASARRMPIVLVFGIDATGEYEFAAHGINAEFQKHADKLADRLAMAIFDASRDASQDTAEPPVEANFPP